MRRVRTSQPQVATPLDRANPFGAKALVVISGALGASDLVRNRYVGTPVAFGEVEAYPAGRAIKHQAFGSGAPLGLGAGFAGYVGTGKPFSIFYRLRPPKSAGTQYLFGDKSGSGTGSYSVYLASSNFGGGPFITLYASTPTVSATSGGTATLVDGIYDVFVVFTPGAGVSIYLNGVLQSTILPTDGNLALGTSATLGLIGEGITGGASQASTVLFAFFSTDFASIPSAPKRLTENPWQIFKARREFRSADVPLGNAGAAVGSSTVNGIGRTLVRSTGTASGTGAASGASNSGQTGVRGRHRLVRTKQPQYAVAIDRANPLTRGLDLAFVPTLHGANPAGASFGFLGTPTPTRVGKKGEVAYSVVNGQNSAITAFPVIGAVPFTILAGVTLKNLNAPSFDANPGDSSAVIYSQRDNDSTRSPTLCIAPSGGFGGSNGLFFGTDAAGTAHGANSSVAAPTGVPTVLGARSDPAAATVAGYSYNGLSIFVDGKNTTTAPSSTAGPFSNDWNPLYPAQRVAIIGGHAEWPSQDYTTRDDADAEYTFFFRWRRLLSDAEIAQVTTNPWQLFRARRDLSIGTFGVAVPAGTAAGTSTALAVGQRLLTATAAAAGTSTVLGAPVITVATLLGSSYTIDNTGAPLSVTFAGGETVIVVLMATNGYGGPTANKLEITDAGSLPAGLKPSGTNNFVPITDFSNTFSGSTQSGVQIFKADKVKAGTYTLQAVEKYGAASAIAAKLLCYRYSGLATGPVLASAAELGDNPGLTDFSYSTTTFTPTKQPALLIVAANEQNLVVAGTVYPEAGYTLLDALTGDNGGTVTSQRITSLSALTPTMRSKNGYVTHSIAAVLIAEYVAPTLDYLAAGNLTRRRVQKSQPTRPLLNRSNPFGARCKMAYVGSSALEVVSGKTWIRGPQHKTSTTREGLAGAHASGVFYEDNTLKLAPIGRFSQFGVNTSRGYSIFLRYFHNITGDAQALFGDRNSTTSAFSSMWCSVNASDQLEYGAYLLPSNTQRSPPISAAMSAGWHDILISFRPGGSGSLVSYVDGTLNSYGDFETDTSLADNLWDVSNEFRIFSDGAYPWRYLLGAIACLYVFEGYTSAEQLKSLSANPWQIFKGRRQPVAAAPIVTAQFLRPASDISAGAWTPSTGVDLYATLDETPANDSDYDSTVSASAMTVKLGVGASPGISTGHIVRYRIKGTSIVTVTLLQGSTSIASWVHSPAPTNFTTYEQTLTSMQAAAISDYSDLRVKIEAS